MSSVLKFLGSQKVRHLTLNQQPLKKAASLGREAIKINAY